MFTIIFIFGSHSNLCNTINYICLKYNFNKHFTYIKNEICVLLQFKQRSVNMLLPHVTLVLVISGTIFSIIDNEIGPQHCRITKKKLERRNRRFSMLKNKLEGDLTENLVHKFRNRCGVWNLVGHGLCILTWMITVMAVSCGLIPKGT